MLEAGVKIISKKYPSALLWRVNFDIINTGLKLL